MRCYSILLLALCLLPGIARAADELEAHPGYVDLTAIETISDEEASIEVYLKGPVLRLVAEATRHDEPELADMLTRLKIIQVRGFDLKPDPEEVARVKKEIKNIAKQLESQGWEKVVRVRERHEHVDVYLKLKGEAIIGLTVIAGESNDEIILVNIAGDIDPAQIGRIGRRFNITPLDSLHLDHEDLKRREEK